MKKIVLRADVGNTAEERKKALASGLEFGLTDFIVRKTDSFENLGDFNPIYADDAENEFVTIDSPEKMEYVMGLKNKKRIIIQTKDWNVIPMENVISKFSGTGTEIFVVVKNSDDAVLFLSVMEVGVDGIVVENKDVIDMGTAFENKEKIQLQPIKIKSVSPLQKGDRVCVDTCSMMGQREGMLVGSQSNCLFLVESEAEENGYVSTRPFRVNAGAVHSYILVPGKKTKYLSEMKSGESVIVCDGEGNLKNASVGRSKIEVRPMVIVTAENNSTIILQNAETVKLVGKNKSYPVTELKPGDEVLAFLSKSGRHFGMEINETITEL